MPALGGFFLDTQPVLGFVVLISYYATWSVAQRLLLLLMMEFIDSIFSYRTGFFGRLD